MIVRIERTVTYHIDLVIPQQSLDTDTWGTIVHGPDYLGIKAPTIEAELRNPDMVLESVSSRCFEVESLDVQTDTKF